MPPKLRFITEYCRVVECFWPVMLSGGFRLHFRSRQSGIFGLFNCHLFVRAFTLPRCCISPWSYDKPSRATDDSRGMTECSNFRCLSSHSLNPPQWNRECPAEQGPTWRVDASQKVCLADMYWYACRPEMPGQELVCGLIYEEE